MYWLQRLEEEAKKIIEHTDGELSLVARPLGTEKVKVIIKAGKSWTFTVRRYEED